MSEMEIDRRGLMLGAGLASLAVTAGAAMPRTAAAQGAIPGDRRAGKRFVPVLDRTMAYYEVGEGAPIVFLHGNPTSSYLWRNIIPHVSHLGRCVAIDLIGMGDSDKLPDAGPGTYDYLTHREYLFEMLRVLGIESDITLVVHDWGSGLGFDFASQNPAAIRAIAYMEAILRPPGSPPANPTGGTGLFGQFQTEEGEKLVLDQNIFVEQLLIGGLGYYLSEADKDEYRRPFNEPGAGRWPALQWPRELPAFSATTAAIAEGYTNWLATEERIPKLLVHAVPGAILSAQPLLDFVRGFHNQTEVTVYGTHYVQEFAPDAIGRALAEWLTNTVIQEQEL